MKKPATKTGSAALSAVPTKVRVVFAGKMLLRRRNQPPGTGQLDFESGRSVVPLPRAQPVRPRRMINPVR